MKFNNLKNIFFKKKIIFKHIQNIKNKKEVKWKEYLY